MCHLVLLLLCSKNQNVYYLQQILWRLGFEYLPLTDGLLSIDSWVKLTYLGTHILHKYIVH